MILHNLHTIQQAHRIKRHSETDKNQLRDKKQLYTKIFVYGIITLLISLLYYYNNTYHKKTPESFIVTDFNSYTGHSKSGCYDVYE